MLEFLWPWVALVWPLPLLIRWLWPATPVPPQALQVPFLERLQQLSDSSQTPRFQTQQLALHAPPLEKSQRVSKSPRWYFPP